MFGVKTCILYNPTIPWTGKPQPSNMFEHILRYHVQNLAEEVHSSVDEVPRLASGDSMTQAVDRAFMEQDYCKQPSGQGERSRSELHGKIANLAVDALAVNVLAANSVS